MVANSKGGESSILKRAPKEVTTFDHGMPL